MTRVERIGALLLCSAFLALAACESGTQSQQRRNEPCNRVQDPSCNDTKIGRATEGRLGDTFGTTNVGNVQIGGDPLGRGTSVNKHLWKASLDTLSFLPIASTDPFTGVIATDWSAAPNAPNERLKVTAYVRDTSLTAEALRVAVFREELADNGVWVSAPVDAATPRQLEDAILTRARQLRREELSEEG